MQENAKPQRHARYVIGVVVATLASMFVAPQGASAALNDLVVVNGGTVSFTICKSAASTTSCVTTSPRGTLLPGQNSKTKFGWADTDMILLSSGCTLSQYTWYQSSMMWMPYAVANSTRWIKVSGSNGNPIKYKVTC